MEGYTSWWGESGGGVLGLGQEVASPGLLTFFLGTAWQLHIA